MNYFNCLCCNYCCSLLLTTLEILAGNWLRDSSCSVDAAAGEVGRSLRSQEATAAVRLTTLLEEKEEGSVCGGCGWKLEAWADDVEVSLLFSTLISAMKFPLQSSSGSCSAVHIQGTNTSSTPS